jgi:hypothetical protein
MAGDRQLVREAVAAYFGGTLQTSDAGIYYQGGPLVSSGLGTAYPYPVKGVPDGYYTEGMAEGAGWGAVMDVTTGPVKITRQAIGGPVSGWRVRRYETRCGLFVLSEEPHLETTALGLDGLIDALLNLIYADRTLGTTTGQYTTGRLIEQAGEGTYGIEVTEPEWEVDKDRGRSYGHAVVTFQADTYVIA